MVPPDRWTVLPAAQGTVTSDDPPVGDGVSLGEGEGDGVGVVDGVALAEGAGATVAGTGSGVAGRAANQVATETPLTTRTAAVAPAAATRRDRRRASPTEGPT